MGSNYSNEAFKKGTPEYFRRKADQHWEMAGLARQDNDAKDAEHHTVLAREYQQKARDAE